MAPQPLCFVLMPFATKKDPGSGLNIDFDKVYQLAIQPAIEDAGMLSIRADEESTGGIIHKAMFERLMLCDYAVADLTTANANVFYELGVRHAVRPSTTQAIFATEPPFDLTYLRGLRYVLGERNAFGEAEAARLRKELGTRLKELRDERGKHAPTDSPIFQLLEDYPAPDVARLKTDTFRERAEYAADRKALLARARQANDVDGLRAIEGALGAVDAVEAGVLVDLFLSYRAVSAWDRMVDLYERMPVTLRNTVLIREQLGFAYNRLGRRDDAEAVLLEVLRQRGPSSETCGILGRVYKDQWADAKKSGNDFLASGQLDRAIETYIQGFEADIRDAYPGINAVTLLEIKGSDHALAQQKALLPVVRLAVKLRLSGEPDYWDHATLLELAVLAGDAEAARKSLGDALARVRESWEPQSTANNIRLIQDARAKRGIAQAWLDDVIRALDQAASAG